MRDLPFQPVYFHPNQTNSIKMFDVLFGAHFIAISMFIWNLLLSLFLFLFGVLLRVPNVVAIEVFFSDISLVFLNEKEIIFSDCVSNRNLRVDNKQAILIRFLNVSRITESRLAAGFKTTWRSVKLLTGARYKMLSIHWSSLQSHSTGTLPSPSPSSIGVSFLFPIFTQWWTLLSFVSIKCEKKRTREGEGDKEKRACNGIAKPK